MAMLRYPLSYTGKRLNHYPLLFYKRNKVPERIAEAETALAMRARDLFYSSGDRFEEEESLDDAMCVLNALRSSLKCRALLLLKARVIRIIQEVRDPARRVARQ